MMSGARLCGELGFKGHESLDPDSFEWPFQYEEARPLLDWICSALLSSNVLFLHELSQYVPYHVPPATIPRPRPPFLMLSFASFAGTTSSCARGSYWRYACCFYVSHFIFYVRGSRADTVRQLSSTSRPSLSIWRRKKEMGKEGLFVVHELKRLSRSCGPRMESFVRSHVSRLVRTDLFAVLAEFQHQDLVFLASDDGDEGEEQDGEKGEEEDDDREGENLDGEEGEGEDDREGEDGGRGVFARGGRLRCRWKFG